MMAAMIREQPAPPSTEEVRMNRELQGLAPRDLSGLWLRRAAYDRGERQYRHHGEYHGQLHDGALRDRRSLAGEHLARVDRCARST